MNEFQLIQQIQRGTPVRSDSVKLGIGDDAAVVEIPAGQHLVAATDTLNAGIHFPADTAPFDIGYKCLAVNLSDLAAMGATPRWALLSLSLPRAEHEWVQSFIAGFTSLAQEFGVVLIGGDTTSGPLSISLTALGTIESGSQLQRGGAQAGDLVVVSGTVGGAARVLDLLQDENNERDPHRLVPDRQLLDRPQPRVRLGRLLVGNASACIDISDGLFADLGHLLKASGCAATLETGSLPAPGILDSLEDDQKWSYQLAGGDDYELLFTLPPHQQAVLGSWSKQLDLELSVIGKVEDGVGIHCMRPDGSGFNLQKSGFDHFEDKS